MTEPLQTVLGGLAFAEGPRWRDGRLYFSDMHVGEVVAMTPDGKRETVLKRANMTSGLGWTPSGAMLIVEMQTRRVLRREPDGRVVTHADLSGLAEHWTNDMVVDAQGGAYVGNFGFSLVPPEDPRPATLARIDPDGTVRAAARDMMFPNGMVITPDGKTLIVGESFAGRLTAFDIAPNGDLSNRRVWAQLPQGAVPDGICLDAEGAVWAASPTTNEVLRVRAGGDVLERVAASRQAIACMLGGADRRTLYVLTAETTDPNEGPAKMSAAIEATQVSVPGAGLP